MTLTQCRLFFGAAGLLFGGLAVLVEGVVPTILTGVLAISSLTIFGMALQADDIDFKE